MSTETVQTTATGVTVTDIAKAKLQEFLGDKNMDDLFLRIHVMPGGCSGYRYGLEFAESLEEGETALDAAGLKVAALSENVDVLNGVTVDYIDQEHGAGFKVDNPNAKKGGCGCGTGAGHGHDHGKQSGGCGCGSGGCC